jgi:hypothetical protein
VLLPCTPERSSTAPSKNETHGGGCGSFTFTSRSPRCRPVHRDRVLVRAGTRLAATFVAESSLLSC